MVQRGLQAIESLAPGPVQQTGEHRRRYLRRGHGGRRRGADDGRHGGGDRPRSRRGPFPQCRPDDAAGSLRQFQLRCRNGAWTYTLDNDSEAVKSLLGEAIVTDSFLVMSLDGTASKSITVWMTRHGFTDT
ncbi:MAG: VCBS domain-containing protein [Pararhodobacter sp.]